MQAQKQRTILRISKDKENPYILINKNVMQDERLSWKARGLMGYLLSLPDDWVIYLEELEKHSDRDGRESLASGIKELIQYGYITREQNRVKGKFTSYIYTVYESPQLTVYEPQEQQVDPLQPPQLEPVQQRIVESTANGFTVSGFTVSGKPVTTNTDLTNTDFTKKINNKKKLKPYTKQEPKPRSPKIEKYAKFYL